MLVSHGAIILVIDGARMSLFRNRAKNFMIDLEVIDHDAKHVARTAELGTDKPGRSFSSMGQGRSAYQSSDFHQAEEDAFALAATERLNKLAHEFDVNFIVVATPRVLGFVRQHYSAELRKRLVAEIDKDIAGRPTQDVAALLRHYES
jgi:protein required for attachment to host cells